MFIPHNQPQRRLYKRIALFIMTMLLLLAFAGWWAWQSFAEELDWSYEFKPVFKPMLYRDNVVHMFEVADQNDILSIQNKAEVMQIVKHKFMIILLISLIQKPGFQCS